MIELVAVTKGVGKLEGLSAEEIITYCARVSNPKNQLNLDTAPKLLKYCINHGHYSVFETAYMTVEIETNLVIAAQILRHRSFTFQQFSGRYAEMQDGYEEINARRQDKKNRQNSINDLEDDVKEWFLWAQEKIWQLCYSLYLIALQKNIAKEVARFLLPLNTKTRMYMTGNARSWIFYLKTRTAEGVQEEHKKIAEEIKTVFCEQFPTIAEALEWSA